jgi:putative transposase
LWFGKLKQRRAGPEQLETLEQARAAIGAYVERYHHRPHQGVANKTPLDVATSWKDPENKSTHPA